MKEQGTPGTVEIGANFFLRGACPTKKNVYTYIRYKTVADPFVFAWVTGQAPFFVFETAASTVIFRGLRRRLHHHLDLMMTCDGPPPCGKIYPFKGVACYRALSKGKWDE